MIMGLLGGPQILKTTNAMFGPCCRVLIGYDRSYTTLESLTSSGFRLSTFGV